ncbi:YpdA family putative bacillithiol disulfide reductase [Fulvivirgaceae bacterium BMA12]|uniref:YpdA family putative bacillithiol disulfide reductase n=1 Tax=Agaribacillus aureus TaxID=3051825 RepID=A0ABT8LE64_9BACT|nr:YpdA family putative bacillithiol disulfide reductase [Fulvivirgaceae bacterium BMA12]
MTVSGNYDVIIIGAGPIGLACGIEAKKSGLSYVIIDKGCLVNSLYNYPLNMTFFSTSEKLEIGDVPFISHGAKPNRTEALEYYRRVASSWQLELKLYEEVVSVDPSNAGYRISTSKGSYDSKTIIIATGFYDLPYLMHVEGEELPKVKHYYDEPHPYFDQNLAVVGAANSAIDVALETYRKGAHVTMVIREDKISDSVKYWVKPDAENRIKEGSIKAYFNSSITSIRADEIDIESPEGHITIPNDFVLAMTGYRPNFELLKSIGIELQKDEMQTPVYNEETNETNVKNVYLAGVICGGLKTNKWFIENSRVHAELIIKDIKNKLS